jgi:hypothetical protein
MSSLVEQRDEQQQCSNTKRAVPWGSPIVSTHCLCGPCALAGELNESPRGLPAITSTKTSRLIPAGKSKAITELGGRGFLPSGPPPLPPARSTRSSDGQTVALRLAGPRKSCERWKLFPNNPPAGQLCSFAFRPASPSSTVNKTNTGPYCTSYRSSQVH